MEIREITELQPGLWRVAGSTELDVLREKLRVDIPENDEVDTLGGLIIGELSNVPEDGSTVDVKIYGMEIHVDEIRDRRIEWTTIRIPPKEETPQEES